MQPSKVVSCTWGSGKQLAVVMSPVMPEWDEGQFFLPMTIPLVQAGFRVIVFDTLSLLSDKDESLDDFSHRWHQELLALGQIDLLVGSALGGAVVQVLLGKELGFQVKKVLLLSSPAIADPILDCRLGKMADLAMLGDIATALYLLDQLVQPASRISPTLPIEVDLDTASLQARRLHLGFRLLNRLDVRQASHGYTGTLLTVYGEQSQLVRAVNVHINEEAQHYRLPIPDGGMRPLLDAPALVMSSVFRHLGISLGTAA